MKEQQLIPGQNLRYIGKGFPGFVKGQPYMVFLGYKGAQKILVKYNNLQMMVSKSHAEALKF